MKRNLSSQAIKAMAIGMAVMMGSSTAISGVITGTVVNAYAAAPTITITNPSSLVSVVTTSSYIVTESGLLFKVKNAGTTTTGTQDDGTVTLLGTVANEFTGKTATNGQNIPFMGLIEGNKLVIKSNNTTDVFKFEIEEIGDGSNPLAEVTLSDSAAPDFASYATPSTIDGTLISSDTLTIDNTNGLTIKPSAFKGVTLTGNLTLSGKISAEAGAFKGIKGTNSTIDLSGATGGTIDGGAFSDSTGTEKTTYGTLKIKDFTSKANSFNNVDVTGTLEFTGTPTLNTTESFKPDTAGNTINKLVLPTSFNGGVDGLFATNTANYTITNLDLTGNTNALTDGTFKNTTITNLTHNGKALMNGATITNLTFDSGVTSIEDNAFKGATVPKEITLNGITDLKASALEIANANATDEQNAVTVKMPNFDTSLNNTNVDTKISTNSFGTAAGKYIKLVLPNTISDDVVTALNQGGGKAFTNTNVKVEKEAAQNPDKQAPKITNAAYSASTITLTADEALSAIDAKSDFGFVINDSKTSKPVEGVAITSVKADDDTNTISIGLDNPLPDGSYYVTYTQPTTEGNKIKDKAGNALENISQKTLSFQVGQQQEELTFTTGTKTYTFEKISGKPNEVLLKSFVDTSVKKSSAKNSNTFVNGVLTTSAGKYTLTQIGDGKTTLGNVTTDALKGHTNNVTVVKKDAFKGNTVITEISLPKVTTVEAGAFNGATKLATMDLGSETANKVTIANDALVGTTSLKNITTNAASASDIKNKVPNANVVVQSESNNDSKASIRYNAYYQTKDGLRFVGINDKELKFVGTKTYQEPTNGKFDGTEANPYEVTYDKTNGTVTVTPGKDEVVVDTVEVTQNGYKLTFDVKDSNATLTNAVVSKTKATTTTGTLANGVVTDANGKTYNFTTIGNGTALPTTFNATDVLGDANLVKVTTIAKDAFKGNTVTTELTLPTVTTIGEGAFNGATALTKVDLGTNEVTVGADAFNGATSVKVTSGNQTTIDNVINDGKLDAGNVETPESKKFVKSAVIENANAKEIKLTLNGNLGQALDAKDGFSVKVTGDGDTTQTVQDVTGGDNGTITITLDKNIEAGQKVTISYDGTNTKGDDLLAFTDKAVENNVGVVAPEAVTIGSATADATKIILTISEGGLKNISQQAPTGFTVTKGGSTATDKVTLEANGLTVKGNNTIELTVQGGIAKTDGNIKVTYAGGNENLVKDANSAPITITGTKLVTNTTDSTAPTFSTLTGEYTTNTITLTADEYLKPITEASANGFTLKLGTLTGSATVTNVEIAEDSKDIVLTIDEGSLDGTDGTITVKYTQPNGGKNIADINGNEIATDDSTGVVVTVTSRVETASLEKAVKGYVEYNTTSTTGDVTVISVETAPANSVELQNIQAILTNKLTRIERLTLKGYTSLDFSKVNVSNLNIYGNAITGGTLNITGLNSAQQLELARRVNGISGIEINYKTPQQIIDINYGSGSSNNGSSSGGSSSGSSSGGAIIGGVTDGNTENNNNNNNNTNNQVSQDKQLTFDVIKLPSINGEPKMFGDVPANHWAKSYIDKLSTAGIINGANGNFMPNGQTKRADVTIMLVNLLGLSPEVNNKFADVNPNAYYAPYVGTASSYGIVNGSNGMFNPEGIISRQDTMVMIAQILKGLNLNVNTDASSLGQFSDLGSVSNYAQESVAILVNSGIITGNNGKLNPKAPVTRAEMATIMSKLYDVLAAAK